MAAVSAEGSTVCVLIRRLNFSCSRSIAFVVRALRHGGVTVLTQQVRTPDDIAPAFDGASAAELHEVTSRPASLLSARFETDSVAADIARRTAEESVKDAGALPLLSYLLDDMWTRMIARGDGMLRLPTHVMEIGGVLAERADAFLAQHPNSQEALRRVLTLKLATVREDSEPTRRRAWRNEFTDEEWQLVSELANHPNRLLVIATPQNTAASAGEITS
jgi:Novel STAND NTPase 1